MSKSETKSTATPGTAAKQESVPLATPAVPLSGRLGNLGLLFALRRAAGASAGVPKAVQAKLTINPPDDIYEQEADRVADQVMRAPANAGSVAAASARVVQRVCGQCEQELQRHATYDSVPQIDVALESSIGSLAGGGDPLPASVRAFMEPRFGVDFRAVRVHADARAHSLARAVEAKAFTVGNNVVFGAGHYAPETDEGKRLLAHELTHTIQQSGAVQRAPQDAAPAAEEPGTDARIVKIVIDKVGLQATYYLEDETGAHVVTRRILEHCDPKPGLYHAPIARLEGGKLAFRLPKGTCEESKDSIFRVEGRTPGTLEGTTEIDVVVIGGAAGEFLTPRDRARGKPLDAATRARIGEKLLQAGVTEADFEDYRANGTRSAAASGDFERAIDAFLATRAARQEERRDEAVGLAGSMGYDISAAQPSRGGVEASMIDLYKAYLGFAGANINNAYLRATLGASLRQPLDAQLMARYGIDTTEFERRISVFEQSFRKVTVGFALEALNGAERICRSYLREVEQFEGTSGILNQPTEMLKALDPVRASIESDYEAARWESLKAIQLQGARAERAIVSQKEVDAQKEKAAALEKAAADRVTHTLSAFAFIGWPDFPRERLLEAKTAVDAGSLVTWYLREHIAAIRAAREQLTDADNARRLYRLDSLLYAAKRHFGIETGSVYDLIIGNEVERASQSTTFEKLELVLTFALIVTSLLVPGAAVVTATALAGVSVVQAYQTLVDYYEGHAVFEAGLASVDPSQLWAVVALVGAGLDVGTAVHTLDSLPQLRRAVEQFNASRQPRELADALRQIPDLDPQAAAAIERDANARKSAAIGGGDGAGKPPRPPIPDPSRPPIKPEHQRLLDRLSQGPDPLLGPALGDRSALPLDGVYRRGITDPNVAYGAYNEAYAGAAGREVALYHNPFKDEYAVVIGDRNTTRAPIGEEGWESVVHNHPVADTVLPLRLPSPQDMENVLARSGAADRVYEFIEFDIPGVGRGRTEFGIDHAFPGEPFYVTIRRPNEAPQTLRFRDIDEFAAYRSKDTIFAEPGSGLHTDLLEDARAQARIRQNPGDDWGGRVGNATIGGPKGPARGGRILDVGAGAGGKSLTAARIHPNATVHALEPEEDLRTLGQDLLPIRDPKAAARIQWDGSTVQDLIRRGQAGSYSQVNLFAPIPNSDFEAVAIASMDLVAPGGGLSLHTENLDVFSYVQRELHKRGWTVIEIHGEEPIKAFIPDSIPTPGDESFGSEAFYTYGLMAFRPSR